MNENVPDHPYIFPSSTNRWSLPVRAHLRIYAATWRGVGLRQELEKILSTEFHFYKGHFGMGLPFECGDGWFDLLYQLSKDIQALINSGVEIPEFAVSQVKEKFGTLRYYYYGGSDEVSDLVQKAEEASASICEVCGKPGACRKEGGWYSTLCDEHYKMPTPPKA